MPETLSDIWYGLPPDVQDVTVFFALLLPTLVVGALVVTNYRPFALVGAMLWRFRWTSLLFVVLIAVSVGIGVGLIAQERGLRRGTARAADKFDLVVTAPGSEVTMLLAAVYLQPSDVPLLSGAVYKRIAEHENVSLAAPIAYGDSYRGAPVVGTTSGFVEHLSSGALAEGRMFTEYGEAVAGARVGLALGDSFEPAHGVGAGAEEHAHEGHAYTIAGRMPPSGTPWDRAILVPVESVWEVHGLALGHAPERAEQLGPPFDADYFPGTPAILVRAEELWANYALRSEFTSAETMAFFPGAVLAQLHSLLGDVRQVPASVELVGFELKNGEPTYTPLPGIPIKPGSEVVLAPEGLALRLNDLHGALVEDGELEMEIELDIGHFDVHVEIGASDATQHSHAGHRHGAVEPQLLSPMWLMSSLRVSESSQSSDPARRPTSR